MFFTKQQCVTRPLTNRFLATALTLLCWPLSAAANTRAIETVLPPTVPTCDEVSFGESTGISGDFAIVGAPGDSLNGPPNAGVAYVYARSSSGWLLQATLQSNTPMTSGRFGCSVTIDGDTLAVGDDSQSQVHVFTFSEITSTWIRQATLQGGDTATSDQFGSSVHMNDDTLVVGAILDDDSGTNAGAAYVFTRTGGIWTEHSKLLGSAVDENHRFGTSVSVQGDHLLVGSPHGNGDRGEVYAFECSGGSWNEEDRFVAANSVASDRFGFSVSMSGQVALIGAPFRDGAEESAGAAYFFSRSESTWTEQQEISGDAGHFFEYGYSVDVDGTTAVIGTPEFQGGASGSIYVYTVAGNIWSMEEKMTGNGGIFGSSVSICGDDVFAGAPRFECLDEFGFPRGRGEAIAYSRIGSIWNETARKTPIGTNLIEDASYGTSVANDRGITAVAAPFYGSNGTVFLFGVGNSSRLEGDVAGGRFGSAVSVSGTTLAVGAESENRVHIYVLENGSWTLQASIEGLDTSNGDQFGSAVDLDGDTLAVGAILEDGSGNNAGAVYVFTRTGTMWTQEAKLLGSLVSSDARFGTSLSLDGDSLLVGAPFGGPNFRGEVYSFQRSDIVWTEEQVFFGNDSTDLDRFGFSVALSGSSALIGAPQHDGVNMNDGAAYVFSRLGSLWTQEQKLTGDTGHFFHFGCSVTLDADVAVVGTPEFQGNATGSAYLFLRNGDTFSLEKKIVANDSFNSVNFGEAVAISRENDDKATLVVGDPRGTISGVNNGSASLFTIRCLPDLSHRIGNVNAAAGPVADVLFVNDSIGEGAERRVVFGSSDPFELRVGLPPAETTAPYALYVWFGAPVAGDGKDLPFGIGSGVRPMPLTSSCSPQPVRIANNLGFTSVLGAENFPGPASQPAPYTLLDLAGGLGETGIFTIQVLIKDSSSPQGQAAVSNAIVVISK